MDSSFLNIFPLKESIFVIEPQFPCNLEVILVVQSKSEEQMSLISIQDTPLKFTVALEYFFLRLFTLRQREKEQIGEGQREREEERESQASSALSAQSRHEAQTHEL